MRKNIAFHTQKGVAGRRMIRLDPPKMGDRNTMILRMLKLRRNPRCKCVHAERVKRVKCFIRRRIVYRIIPARKLVRYHIIADNGRVIPFTLAAFTLT
jgi:hypothetical protein